MAWNDDVDVPWCEVALQLDNDTHDAAADAAADSPMRMGATFDRIVDEVDQLER